MCCVRQQKFEGGVNGLCVAVSAFLIWVCTFGTSVSIGLYNEDFQREFKASYASVSLIGAINLGVFHCVGPFVSLFTQRWGHRRVAFVGAVFSGVGIAAMTFSPNIGCMYLFFGVLTGCGNGFTVVSAQVLCGSHYNKYRGLTSSFVLSGNGGGATLFPLIISYLMKTYGWRSSLLLLCGLNLHLLPMALALFPAEATRDRKEIEVQQELMTEMDRSKTKDSNRVKDELQADGNESLICEKKMDVNNVGKFKNHVIKFITKEFVTFLISVMTNQMGLGAVVIFLPQYAISLGLNPSDASLSLSLLGVGFFAGCIVAGLLGKQIQLAVYTAGCIGFGIFITLMEVFQQQVIYLCLSTVSGCFAGLQFAPLFIITYDILGGKAIDIGFGYVMFAVGIGLTAGPPCAGWLIDSLGETKYMVYFNCVVTLFSGIVMIPFIVRQILKRCQGVKSPPSPPWLSD